MKNDMKKIIIVLFTLAFLLVGIIYLRNRGKQQLNNLSGEQEIIQKVELKEDNPNSMSLVSAGKPKIGSDFAVNVNFTTDNSKIFGADAVLLFDPEYLEADKDSIEKGDFFNEYPRMTVDEKNGIIKVTAYNSSESTPLNTPLNFFKVNFTAVKTGATQVNFDYLPGATNTTTLVERETSKNILGSVNNLKLTIEE